MGVGGMEKRESWFRNGEVLYLLPTMVEQRFYKEGLCFFRIISKSAFCVIIMLNISKKYRKNNSFFPLTVFDT